VFYILCVRQTRRSDPLGETVIGGVIVDAVKKLSLQVNPSLALTRHLQEILKLPYRSNPMFYGAQRGFEPLAHALRIRSSLA
jgi:hypothetical protein